MRVIIALALAWLPLSCVQPATITCELANGQSLMCGAGHLCLATGCATQFQVTACANQPDGAECAAPGPGRCASGACFALVCGDGNLAFGEACDDGNTDSGDGCSSNCSSNETCGNGVRDPGEACDDGNQLDTDGCHRGCQLPRCGDGIVDTQYNEVCDDGNNINGDGCAARCQSSELCGNGVLDTQDGETCDDGNLVSGDGCQATCQIPRCGDRVHDPGERCDDGNTMDGDGCAANCRSDETCGNGITDVTSNERCDDGNLLDGDGCAADCRSTEVCGNGIRDLANGEICDDGNTTSGDGCAANCRSAETCGNGIRDLGEACDDGNLVDGDGCAANCRSTEICGNLIIDTAAGEQCDDGNFDDGDGCSANCRSNETCGNGVIDVGRMEACDLGSRNANVPDVACRPNCTVRRCGDGVADTGEACDDGNNQDGDGCASNCRSNETCGNHQLDATSPSGGEQCDDLNPAGLSNDGCASTCLVEIPDWHEPRAFDFRWWRHVATYDRGRRVTVLVHNGETFEFDGRNWSLRQLLLNPPARTAGAMVYDPQRARVLLFGGTSTAGQALADLWAYDGHAWTELTTPTGPAATDKPSLIFDTYRGVAVLFRDGVTWEFDDATWRVVTTNRSPTPRLGAYFVFDEARRLGVLHGGSAGQLTYDDTWEYTGSNWRERTTSQRPPHRRDGMMVYQPNANRVVLMGGYQYVWTTNPNGSGYATLTWQAGAWTFNGSDWQTLNITGGVLASPRAYATLVANTGRGELELTGGQNMYGGIFTDTWTIDLATGSRLTHAASLAVPAERAASRMAHGVYEGYTLLFGGSAYGASPFAGVAQNDTWRYDGVNWMLATTPGAPVARWGHGLIYDSKRRAWLMYGGENEFDVMGDTWRFRDGAWQQLNPPASPPRVGSHAMAYDQARDRVVLFGGDDGFFSDSIGTWEFDGTTWARISLPEEPPPRSGASLTYDEAARVLILFGGVVRGETGPPYLADTWAYNGTVWTRLDAEASAVPSPRANHNLVYDPLRRRLVLAGGEQRTQRALQDAWEFTYDAMPHQAGIQPLWRQIPVATPLDRHYHTMAYNPRYQRIDVFGGYTLATTSTPVKSPRYLQFGTAAAPRDRCTAATVDSDGDNRFGCGDSNHPADPDCWARCTPGCDPLTTCAAGNQTLAWPAACFAMEPDRPACGDGTCNADLEDRALCPADCP